MKKDFLLLRGFLCYWKLEYEKVPLRIGDNYCKKGNSQQCILLFQRKDSLFDDKLVPSFNFKISKV